MIAVDPSRPRSPEHYLDVLFRAENARRLEVDVLMGVSRFPELGGELKVRGEPSWNKGQVLPISAEDSRVIAEQLFKSSKAQPGETVVLCCTPATAGVAAEVLRILDREGVQARFDFVNHARDAIFAKHLSDEAQEGAISQLEGYARTQLGIYDEVFKLIKVISNPNPRIKQFDDDDRNTLLKRYLTPVMERLRNGSLHYITTLLPTAADAALDGMQHEDYLRLFMEACDQPWDEIKQAQSILKVKFDQANKIRITNTDGTDITLDISGQTFASSLIQKNLPGSELFSSPLKDGTNGIFVAKGRFQYGTSAIMEDITLVLKDGRIDSFDARVGKEALAHIIQADDNRGEGSRFLGEIGIGTNPHLRSHMINRLLVEKISGSVHLTPGSCYSYTVYDGYDVNLRNGNKSESGVHFDITALLRGKGGQIELIFGNGEVRETVQLNGNWLVAGCEVLNNGWGELPADRRPAWWNERYPNGYAQI